VLEKASRGKKMPKKVAAQNFDDLLMISLGANPEKDL